MKILFRALHLCRRLYWSVFRPLNLGCRVIVEHGEKVLLVKMSYHDSWFLPGGGVDKGETFSQAAIRELYEECHIQVNNIWLQGVYLNTKMGAIDHVAVFVARDYDGVPPKVDGREVIAAQFFHKTDLPKDLSPGHRRRLDEYFASDSNTPRASELW